MQISRKYMIVAGIWFAQHKPTMTTFLKPFIDKVNALYRDGTIIAVFNEHYI